MDTARTSSALPADVIAAPEAARGGEICRKLLHMFPGLLPFGLALVPGRPSPLDAVSLAIVTGLCVVLTAVYIGLYRVVRRPGEEDFFSTALSYPATILATLFLFPAHAEFAGVVVVVLAFGDGAAYIGGKLLGRRRLPWNAAKTWAGSTCFVVCASPPAALAYWMLAPSADSWTPALVCGTAAALAGAAAESLPMRLTDNLRVGLAAASAVAVAHFLIV